MNPLYRWTQVTFITADFPPDTLELPIGVIELGTRAFHGLGLRMAEAFDEEPA